jgi:hypothetical protein
MTDPKPLPTPDVRYMFDQSGKPTQHAYEFLERLVKVTRDANTAIAALQAASNAPSNATYIVQALNGSLSAERRLQVAAPITLTDGGANADITVAINAPVELQVLRNENDTNQNLTTIIPHDDTVPTSSEGDQILTQAITVGGSGANRVRCQVVVMGAVASANNALTVALFRGTVCLDVKEHVFTTTNFPSTITIDFMETPAAGAQTYSVRAGPSASTARINGTSAARLFGGASKCSLTVTEYKG